MTEERSDRPPLIHGIRGVIYIVLGCFFVGLGVLGVMLPVLPTTPFLLLASFFFVRSSPRLNDKLLHSPLFGPFLRDWHRHRGVRPRVKVMAIVVMLAAVTASILFGSLSWWALIGLVVLALIGLTVILRLPVIRAGGSTASGLPIPGAAGEPACVYVSAAEGGISEERPAIP